jgi:tetratricopeptide (TPR) repeat protein
MNNEYKYVGRSLTPRMAQELIVELFTGQTVQRQEIIERVDQVHLERGGQPAQAATHPVKRVLSAMKTAGRAENPKWGFWSIASNTIEGTEVVPARSGDTEPQQIKTLDAFLKWAAQFDTKENSTKYLFRGVSNADYEIDASAYRRVKKGADGDEKPDEEFERFLQLNRDLIRDARFRGHDRRNGRELADLEILAGFQHYGAATCLIDFTYNPLVALWFACKPESDNPSKKCCSCNQKPKISPIAGKVVAVRPNDFREFREITLDSLQKKIDELLADNEGNVRERLYQWQPWHQNNRILAQQSIFLFGVLKINPDRDTECIIDGSSKEEIRESLKQIYGITEDMLFPDFDGFAGQHSQDIPYAQRTASQYRASGDRLYRREKYKDAIPEYDMAIRRDPDRAETYYQRGLVKFHLRQYEGAVTDFYMAIDRNSDYAEAYFQRGLANAENEKYREAITDYDKAIHRGLDTADIYYNRGNINARLQEYEAAAEDYDEAIYRGLDTADVYYNRGIMSALLEIYEAALGDYDEAIRRGFDTADVYYNRGNINARLQEYEAAAEDYDEAIYRGLDTADVYYNRGIMSALLEIYEAALGDYDEAIRRDPNYAEAYYNRGGVLAELGYTDEAEQVFQTALQLARQTGNERLIVEIEQYIRDMNLDTGENP